MKTVYQKTWVVLLLSTVLVSACTTTNANLSGKISYLDNIKNTFASGEKALALRSFEEAIGFFEQIRNQYPYSKYAALSDLRLADAYFAQEKWLESADAYDFFLRFHPLHEEGAHAWLKMGMSYYNLRPNNYFFLPDRSTKDQTAANQAIVAFERFLKDFPEHEKAAEVTKLRIELRNGFAEREMKVAEFYAQRKKWPAVINRYELIAALFADTDFAPQALFKAALVANNKLNKPEQARNYLEKLLANYQNSNLVKDAKQKLNGLAAL